MRNIIFLTMLDLCLVHLLIWSHRNSSEIYYEILTKNALVLSRKVERIGASGNCLVLLAVPYSNRTTTWKLFSGRDRDIQGLLQ